MTILVTGGSGRTSSAVAKRLHAANIPFLVLSRSGTAPAPFDACRFDFYDESTFETPFAKASDIDAIYVVVPTIVSDTVDQPVNAFIDFARAKGVKRFVVLTASNYDPPTRIAGAVHQHLMDVGDVEYAVMRPTWYMENFTGAHVPSIKGNGTITSASRDGKARWISTDDVGAAAFRALTDKEIKNSEHLLLGPELLSYDDIAQILSEVLGRKITHERLSPDAYRAAVQSFGLTGLRLQMMAEMQEEFANNDEARPDNGEVLRLTGQQPIRFRDWAEKNKAAWE